MDSSGYIYDMEPDGKLSNKSPEPVPDPMRGLLVMKALEAAPIWWPEMAPLTKEERAFVLARVYPTRTTPAKEQP